MITCPYCTKPIASLPGHVHYCKRLNESCPLWLLAVRDAVVMITFLYALYWLLMLGCVGIHGAKACGV